MKMSVSADPGFSFEAVLDAVQESGRGRWFLEEYKARIAREDSGRVLAAIEKLDRRMDGFAREGAAAADLATVKAAISSTRDTIFKAGTIQGLSEEGQLFSHLAGLARKAFPTSGADIPKTVPESIVEVLKLVEQLDSTLNRKDQFQRAAPKAEQFFERDKDLFEAPAAAVAAPVAKPTLVAAPVPAAVAKPTAKVSEPDGPQTGAKLTISRAKPSAPATVAPEPVQDTPPSPAKPDAIPAAEAAATLAPPVEPAPPSANTASLPVEAPSHPRIVIIRRKPEDMPDVPTPAESPAEPSAA